MENENKVIKYKVKNLTDNDDAAPSSERKYSKPNSNNSHNPFINRKTLIIIISSIIGALILAGIIILIIFLKSQKTNPPDTPIIGPGINDKLKKLGPLENQIEYVIPTNENDLKRIYINQRYYEDISIEGVLSHNLVDRKTNYDIYIIKKIEAKEEEKLYYNYTFYCSIAVASECVSTRDEFCLPKKLVDLNDQDYSHVRNLDESDDLENIPIPLCFFNITDNNVITGITCHKNITQSKVNSIVLDLYFFRPPGIKRMDKEKVNITMSSRKEGDNEIIREINGGLCEMENAFNSFCSTDMNTTKDSNGNLIAYDELCFTNITKDENNYYIKKKYTTLLDKTEFVNNLSPEKYNETLNNLYPNLQQYLKNYVHFSLDNFRELYNVSKGIKTEDVSKRNLVEEKRQIINNEALFNFTHFGGVQITIGLKNNAGYNTQAIQALNLFEIDEETVELANLKEFSDIDKVISRLVSLSRAGNNLATALYEKIKDHLNNITEIITINIPNITSLVAYKELLNIFDSTYSLENLKVIPFEIKGQSNDLITRLEKIKTDIENGSLKDNLRVLNNYIYNYNKQYNKLVNKISENLKELTNLIKSPKQTISYISTYYMNHTSTSYVNAIKEAKNVLMNYYINEKDLIIPEVNEILKQFEEITMKSIQRQLNLVNKLNEKLENNNLTIIDANDEYYRGVITNLYNSKNYINQIIELFKKKVEKEMDLKEEYFISKYDIESNNDTFSKIINEALNISQNLDDNEYIDKTFDEIMTTFRNDFTSIIKEMEVLKEENFPMIEKTPIGGNFEPTKLQVLAKELKELSVDISNKIINENDLYVNSIKEKVDKFLQDNKKALLDLMTSIESIFSEESLDNLAKLYDSTFNGYLNKIDSTIQQNKALTTTYFDGMAGLLTNNENVINLLKNYPVDKRLPSELNCVDPKHCWQYTKFDDTIYNKYKTYNYYNKYKIYKAKFDTSIDFINGNLQNYIFEEYANIIYKLKGVLQTFKGNKLSDKYPEFDELNFIDKHIKDIDTYYTRLSKYISNDKFNNNYKPKIQNYKNRKKTEIEEIKNYIEKKHSIIYNKGDFKSDINNNNNDICVTFRRLKTYTCTNGAVRRYWESKEYVCIVSWGYDNHNKYISLSFQSDSNFDTKFKNFYSSLKSNIDSYNNKIIELKTLISSIEKDVLNQKKTEGYLSPIQEKINTLIPNNYSDNLIRLSYNYYKKLLDTRLDNILRNSTNKWNNSYDILEKNLNNSNFKYSTSEFGLMALIYEVILSQNLTKTYYDSIIEHQKSEFNYTISYYYNCLLQNITSAYQYIINKIPRNQEGFNNIINLRKEEVNEIFNILIKSIKDSKTEALRISRQAYVLEVSPQNFFNMSSVLTKNIGEAKNILNTKGMNLYRKESKQNNEFSLACRFYLENSLNGWQIEELYKPINDKIFVTLNTEQFKEIISSNWIFDQDHFINKLNLSIYNSNLEIKKVFAEEKKQNYINQLEDQIKQFYTKESIAQKVSDQYQSQIKEISHDKATLINQYIQVILNKIKEHLSEQENILLQIQNITYSNDFSKINDTLKNYKDKLINDIKEIIIIIVNDFYNNMMEKAYNGRIENDLNLYLNEAEKYNVTCKGYESLSEVYNIGEIIYEYVKDLIDEYKNLAKMKIKLKKDEYIEKLYREIGINDIIKEFDNVLNPYFSKLLTALKKVSTNNKEGIYPDYDLIDSIKEDINSIFNQNIEKINKTINEIKGEEFNVVLKDWYICDFESVSVRVFDIINKDFEIFIKKKIDNEKKEINKLLKDIISNNFNILIDNLINSFGNEFFERIMKYNENFKITSLYQNLKYSLVVSLLYYGQLYSNTKINALTKDLKFKLYGLNNLDSIAQEKNKIVLNLLNNEVNKFIEESKLHLMKFYKLFLKEDASIQMFNQRILKSIASNLEEITPELEKSYEDLLNEKFKNKLISSYTKIMNAQTNDMIQTVYNLKENVRAIFDDLFTLDIDKVLNETNYKMNVTLDSIKEYDNYFNSFKIPQDLINFINSYGTTFIQPAFEKIETLINKETKNLTKKYLDKNSQDYEKYYDSNKIIRLTNETYSSLKINNVEPIIDQAKSYGINENEYHEILHNEINRIERRNLRRLNDEQTEEDINEEYKEKVADKSVDDNFHKILKSIENAVNFIKSYENFDKFEEIIDDNIKKLNNSYKDSQNTIDEVYKDDDMYDILNNTLERLNNKSLNYYIEIKNKFKSLREYIENSINEIDNLLNKCANSTYKEFANQYEAISNDAESIDKEQNNKEEDINTISHTSITQNTEYITEVDISSIIKKAKFKFSLKTEGNGDIKRPKVEASVTNQMRPDSVTFKIYSPFGTCGKNIQEIKVNFNNVNYTTKIHFDTNSTIINVSTIGDFDAYNYYVGKYRVENSDENHCNEFLGIKICTEGKCDNENRETIEFPIIKTQNRKVIEENSSIDG